MKDLLPAPSGCWQNSVPGCETLGPVVWLLVDQGVRSVSRGCSQVPALWPLHTSNGETSLVLKLFHVLNLFDFSFCGQPEKTLCF